MAAKKVWEIKIRHPDDGNSDWHVAAVDIDTAITAAIKIFNQRMKENYGKADPPVATSKHITSAVAGAELDG